MLMFTLPPSKVPLMIPYMKEYLILPEVFILGNLEKVSETASIDLLSILQGGGGGAS